MRQKDTRTGDEKLAASLVHAIDMERRATSRVARAATLLKKWKRVRTRIERKIGNAEVARIVNRLSAKPVTNNPTSEEN